MPLHPLDLTEIRHALATEKRDLVSANSPDNFLGLGGFAPTAANVSVNEQTALQSAAVFGCVRIISGLIASQKLHVYELLDGGGRQIATDHPLEYLLSTRPSDELDAYMLKETALIHLLTRGNAFFVKLRNKLGKVTQIDLLSPFATTVYRNSADGSLVYQFVGQDSRTYSFQQADIIHVRNLSWDGIIGMSPIQMYAREAIGLDLCLRNYGARYLANGASASSVMFIKSKLSPADRKQIENDIIASHTGQNAHRALVVGADGDWRNMSISPEEAQFLQTRGFQRNEICAGIYGVPPHLLGDNEQTKAGVSEQNSALLQNTLSSWIARIEAAFNVSLLSNNPRFTFEDARRYKIAFDTSTLDRYTLLETLKTVSTGRQWSLLSINEGRHLLNMNPRPEKWADDLLRPVNMVHEGEEPTPNPAPQAGNGPDNNSGGENPAPTEPDATARFARSLYQRVFQDAFNRVLSRDKRDEKAVSRAFTAPIAAIADYFCMLQTDNFRSGDPLPAPVDTFVQQYLAAMTKRAGNWTENDFENELSRAVDALKQVTSKQE